MTDPRQDTGILPDMLEPPGPPDGLRDRALRRAGAALGRPPARDRWSRVYASRPLRAAWAAAVLFLVVANALLPGAKRRPQPDSIAERAAERVPELAEVVTVPRLREAYASLEPPAASRPAGVEPAVPGPRRKEKTS